jgi:serine beta-lactamase-like protein LACTB
MTNRTSATIAAGFAILAATLALPASRLLAQARPPNVCTAATAESARALITSRVRARLDSAVLMLMTREKIPGFSLAVAVRGCVALEAGYGFADIEDSVRVIPASVFRLASVSKPITATAVMQLVEAGKIDLDAPIQRYAPTFPVKPYPITTRHLLSHLSGIRHYQGDEELSIRQYASLTAALSIFQNDSLLHPPGAKLTYTTFGYTLLGVVIEGASGQSFMDYLRSHILAPIGATSIRDDSVAAIISNRVRGYVRDSTGAIRNAAFLNSSYKLPGGGLVSTAGDLARFGAALQRGRLVGSKSFAQMSTPAHTTDGAEQPYGFGLIIGTLPHMRPGVVWHGGVQQGFTTMLFLDPREDIVLVTLANLEGIGLALGVATNEMLDMIGDGLPRR